MRLLVLGAGGQLGLAMLARLRPLGDVIVRTHAELDISRWADVSTAITTIHPTAIVNCAAYNDVNQAEEEPIKALEANAWGPRNLARAAKSIGATFIHFSTDFVFSGETSRPYTETDSPAPQGRYAASKLLGEWFALESPGAYVLRVESLFGGPRAKSSVDMLLNAVLSGTEARPFSDRVVSPSYVEDVADATAQILQKRPAPGLYHCVNSGMTTWLDLTRELARLTNRPDARITPGLMSEASLKPPRPRFAALSNEKLRNAGIAVPTWQDALRRYVRSIQNSKFKMQN